MGDVSSLVAIGFFTHLDVGSSFLCKAGWLALVHIRFQKNNQMLWCKERHTNYEYISVFKMGAKETELGVHFTVESAIFLKFFL